MATINIEELVPGCKYFRWKEVLYLNRWGIHVLPTDVQYLNLIKVCKKADLVRAYLDTPMTITSALRPTKYNELIGGARFSHHKLGKALDFQCRKIKPDRIRELLEPVLDDFEIRMEDLPGSSWVHIDIAEPGKTGRFFKP